MQLFMAIVQIPEQSFEEREILHIWITAPDFAFWTMKELDGKFDGEFHWIKIGATYGIIALQYMNKNMVRLLIKANDEETATSIIKKFAWHLDAKKFHHSVKRTNSNLKLMRAANDIASRSQGIKSIKRSNDLENHHPTQLAS